jgi:hypothetical protein
MRDECGSEEQSLDPIEGKAESMQMMHPDPQQEQSYF